MLIHEVAKKEIDDMLSEERLERKLRPKTETVDTDRDVSIMDIDCLHASDREMILSSIPCG